MTIPHQSLASILEASCDSAGWQWLVGQRDTIAKRVSEDLNPLYIALAMARRKVGDGPIMTDAQGTASNPVAQWRCDEAARIYLLYLFLNNGPLSRQSIIQEAYARGDEYEKEAILKGLCLLDPDGELKALAVDACRTNVHTLLSSIGMENTYPNMFFTEHEFNQLTLKSLFLGFGVDRILGLRERRNTEMSRMCYDYLRERLAADRIPPSTIWLTIDLQSDPLAEEQFIRYLSDHSLHQRKYVAMSLSWQAPIPHGLKDAVEQHLLHEEDPEIKNTLMAAISDEHIAER